MSLLADFGTVRYYPKFVEPQRFIRWMKTDNQAVDADEDSTLGGGRQQHEDGVGSTTTPSNNDNDDNDDNDDDDDDANSTKTPPRTRSRGAGAGFGCLFSVVFRDPAHGQQFYDALDVPKGPGFGTNFTLSCPYTLLAHYTELEWAAAHGVDASLVRVWVGQEPTEELLGAVARALDSCEAVVDAP